MRKLCLAIGSCALLNVSWAYELQTHEDMSEKAVELSVLIKEKKVLSDMGIKDIKQAFPNSQGDEKDIIELVRNGARFEDGLTPCDSRPRNHFYDPRTSADLRRGLITGKPSPDWALEDNGDINDQEYSYKNARQYLYDALTKSSQAERDKNFGLTFQSLGHVIHHVQDMAQPQHVRNDIHLNFGECWLKQIFGALENPSLYEQWTRARGNLPFTDPNYNQGKPVIFSTQRGFWSGADQKGLAQFTHRNFVSAGTNYQLFNGLPAPNATYPQPVPIAGQSIHIRDLLAEEGGTTDLDGYVDFIANTVIDPIVGDKPNPRSASVSIFDQDLKTYNKTITYDTDPFDPNFNIEVTVDRIPTLNRFNFRAAHEFLIPRAVAYSVGLIDYFFRGRLEGEDVEFSDTGIRLKVKNAIDAQKTPAWSGEVLYANTASGAGTLIISYDYKDATGATRYGTSLPVNMTAGDDIGLGQVSKNVYSFALSIPQGATEVRYRLVFRGRLGQEDDAVVVGMIEPVSGFLVTPNYLPADGIAGPRMIYKSGGQWKLSTEPGLQAGNIDWKGGYKDGKATRVLTWWGPRSRYFHDTSLEGRFRNQIYKDGRVFAVAPGLVFGAAVTRDANGKEWLLAVTLMNGEALLRRPFVRSDSAAMYDPILAPDGWQLVAKLANVPGVGNGETPWFFNGSGTEAQTVRRRTRLEGTINNLLVVYDGLERLKIDVDINASSARRYSLGNFDGFTVTREVHIKPDPSCYGRIEWEYPAFEIRRIRRAGRYVIAADYREDVEVLAVLSETRTEDFAVQVNGELCQSRQASRVIEAKGELALDVDTQHVVLRKEDWLENSQETRKVTAPYFHWDIYEAEIDSEAVRDRVTSTLLYLDLRYGMVVTSTLSQTIAETASGTFGSGRHATASLTETGKNTYELRSSILDKEIWSAERSITTTPGYGFGDGQVIKDPAVDYTETTIEKPDPSQLFSITSATWAIDGSKRVGASQAYYVKDPFEVYGETKMFNYLSEGDLRSLVPGAPSNATFYPFRVVK